MLIVVVFIMILIAEVIDIPRRSYSMAVGGVEVEVQLKITEIVFIVVGSVVSLLLRQALSL